MQRRKFLTLAGASLASLLVLNTVADAATRPVLVRPPARVRVQLEGETHALASADKLTWHYRDVTVRLLPQGTALAVRVQCPGAALRAVVLEWQYDIIPTIPVLGDAWERTYGDVQFQPASFGRQLPWYFVQHGAKPAATVCFGVKTGCNTLCYWQVGEGVLRLTLDASSAGVGVQLGPRELLAATIVATAGQAGEDTFATARRFCGMLCPIPRLPRQPVYGINDWYFAYGNNSADLILQHTRLLADLMPAGDNRPFSVIDAGWAAYSPALPGDCCWQDDFSRPNAKFPDMARLGGDIRQLGMRPGLWTRPLCAPHDTPASRLLPPIAGRNDPRKPVLDPTIAENIALIQRNFATYQSWGYELVKHDFSTFDLLGRWGFEMTDSFTTPGWRFHDNTRTTAEVILDLYRAIRQAAGPAYLIGCDTVGHLAAGLFELNRIGDDTSGLEWDRTRKMGVNTLGFRLVQHNKFFAADGDCVGLTPKVPWAQNEQWLRLLAGSGAPLLVSAQPEAVGAAQKIALKTAFTQAAKVQPVGEPLDWLTTPRPRRWRLDGQVVDFDWS
ncbi:hypothetical protein E4631_11210 [Hymenobacter sp. UV11]|uniref:hypothetical protein n=1 Tax=Hymenobacter sp. UV11 TaxID=1849735 RepID=UPI001060D451|nr:hypothetical protein [Hymenobacter sp. UV11]TFZ66575.1 hypothetical protein E4631_11210 [Hymenobacter sp. UV11]